MPKKSSTAPSRRPWSTLSHRTSAEPLTGLTRTRPRVGVAADHGGFELKGKLIAALKAAGYEIVDFGAYELVDGDDYPDFVVPLARAIAGGTVERGGFFTYRTAAEVLIRISELG